MTILLYFHFGTFRNFKHYYLFFIKGTMKSYFPKAVSYNRFVELESRVFFQLMFFLNLGAFGRCTGITFVDSTMIPAENGGYPPTQNGDIRSLFWLFSLMALQN